MPRLLQGIGAVKQSVHRESILKLLTSHAKLLPAAENNSDGEWPLILKDEQDRKLILKWAFDSLLQGEGIEVKRGVARLMEWTQWDIQET